MKLTHNIGHHNKLLPISFCMYHIHYLKKSKHRKKNVLEIKVREGAIVEKKVEEMKGILQLKGEFLMRWVSLWTMNSNVLRAY